MPGKRAFEEQIAALDALREAPQESRIEPLRKALTERNNFVVAKAADLTREFSLHDLTPDLLKAFDRFFENPEKSDPQCWAKNAISRTLAAFEVQDPEVFLRGMRHIQLEAGLGRPVRHCRHAACYMRSRARSVPPPDQRRTSGASHRSLR